MKSAAKIYAMLGNRRLWDAVLQCHCILDRAAIPHAILGGVAVCLHGYHRNTVDVDVLIGANAAAAVRAELETAGYEWIEIALEFRSPGGIPLRFVVAGEPAGRNSKVFLPDPADNPLVVEIDGVPAISLAQLVELKIASGEGNVRGTHKEFADVVELIAANKLDNSFAGRLDKSVRKTFRELVRHANSN